MPQRKGRGEPAFLSQEEWDEINRITAEIMEGMDCAYPALFEQRIKQVLARNIAAAAQTYETQAAAEEVHAEGFHGGRPVLAHLISECSLDFCGRYRGQRRDSYNPAHVAAYLEPPPAPAGPAAYCQRCARSGVGACDDYPNCPAGRKPAAEDEAWFDAHGGDPWRDDSHGAQ
jgi:hypothetical protein